ncbi:hypothetical protein FB451DRAFT_1406903 [Mycena latifolia]|nr:hypothetical protein FB451DRAFT_1406903 [Mycena latifolia]
MSNDENRSARHPPPQCETRAKSVAAAIKENGATENKLASTFMDSVPVIAALGQTIWRSLPVIDTTMQQSTLLEASHLTRAWREKQRLQTLVEAADAALTSVSLSELYYGCLRLLLELSKEVSAAKEGFKTLESDGWGPHAAKELLSSIRHRIGATISMFQILTLLSVFGEPKIPAQTWEPPLDHIDGTIRDIQNALHPLDIHPLQSPDNLAKTLMGTFADVYGEVAKGATAEHLRIVRSIVETALGSYLKPLLFGADITAECLQDITDLKCLERALRIRLELLGCLNAILDMYNSALAAALKP